MINVASKSVLDQIEIDYRSFVITGCWANINPPGSPHNPHTHPNNLLSGVYYVQAPEGADSICFHEPGSFPYTITAGERTLSGTVEVVGEDDIAGALFDAPGR